MVCRGCAFRTLGLQLQANLREYGRRTGGTYLPASIAPHTGAMEMLAPRELSAENQSHGGRES